MGIPLCLIVVSLTVITKLHIGFCSFAIVVWRQDWLMNWRITLIPVMSLFPVMRSRIRTGIRSYRTLGVSVWYPIATGTITGAVRIRMMWCPTISEGGIARILRVGTVMGLKSPIIAITSITARAITRLRPVKTTRLRDSWSSRRLHHDRVLGTWICSIAHSFPTTVHEQSKTTQSVMTNCIVILPVASANEILYHKNVEWSFDIVATKMITNIFFSQIARDWNRQLLSTHYFSW